MYKLFLSNLFLANFKLFIQTIIAAIIYLNFSRQFCFLHLINFASYFL